MHDTNSTPAELVQGLKDKPAEQGDIVAVHGDLAEVLEVKVSKYGYPAYHVQYIGRSPLIDVRDDWFAGFEVRLVAGKERVEKLLDMVAVEIRKTEGGRPGFQLPTREKLLTYAKKAIVEIHEFRFRRGFPRFPEELLEKESGTEAIPGNAEESKKD